MTKLNIIEFIKNGELAEFPFGTEKEQIIYLLGKPDWIITNEESSVIRYDQIEFYFENQGDDKSLLDAIVIVPTDDSYSELFQTNCLWLTVSQTYDSVKEILKSLKIDFKETSNRSEKTLVTAADVRFMFFPDDNQICKIGRSVVLKK